jgi:threonyl-tRNA synthetase
MAHSWLPKGVIMRDKLLRLWKQSLEKNGVQFVHTPHFVKRDFLKKKSFAISDESLEMEAQGDVLLPVQTPAEAHALLFKTKTRYAAEMPIRYAEVQEIQANSMPQTLLWGMLKTRSYQSDIVNYFCELEQLYEEIISSLQLINKLANLLGFGCQWFLSLNGRKIAGSRKQWDEVSDIMERALKACGFDFVRNEQETAFTGPKIEAKLQDLAGRSWGGPEVGVDFHLPSSLELQYVQEDGRRAQPIMLRQSIFGPLERLVVLLIEKNGGVLPLWLAPEQVRIIAVSSRQRAYAKELLRELQSEGCRATVDMRSDPQGFTLGARIHELECAKVPYALIVGDQEEKEKIVNVRQCGQKATTKRMVFTTFLHQLQEEATFQLPRD